MVGQVGTGFLSGKCLFPLGGQVSAGRPEAISPANYPHWARTLLQGLLTNVSSLGHGSPRAAITSSSCRRGHTRLNAVRDHAQTPSFNIQSQPCSQTTLTFPGHYRTHRDMGFVFLFLDLTYLNTALPRKASHFLQLISECVMETEVNAAHARGQPCLPGWASPAPQPSLARETPCSSSLHVQSGTDLHVQLQVLQWVFSTNLSR